MQSPAPRVLAIAHHDDYDPGLVGERLEQHGYVLEFQAREDPHPYPAPGAHALVLALGSAWMVGDEATRTAVLAEQAHLRASVAAGVPVLGICFGAQQLAEALGGRVERSPEPEIGWYDLETDDPDLVPPGPWMQYHDDAVVPPPGAVVLARSAACVQAFTLPGVLALQFHPEVTESVVARWMDEEGDARFRAEGRDPGVVRGPTPAMVADARPRAHRMVDAFLARIAGRPNHDA